MRPNRFTLRRSRLLESGFNRKFEEVAGERKTLEGLREIFGPSETQQIEEAGLTLPAYVGRLVSVGKQLQGDPEGTLRWLAQQYGVDLGSGSDPYADNYSDELAELRQRAALEQQSNLDREWFAFQNEHPDSENLRQAMGTILALNPPLPHETHRMAFQRAYEAARWTDPGIRKSLLEAEAKKTSAEFQRKADISKAKNAGRTVRSRSTSADYTTAPANTWREELEKNWERISG